MDDQITRQDLHIAYTVLRILMNPSTRTADDWRLLDGASNIVARALVESEPIANMKPAKD